MIASCFLPGKNITNSWETCCTRTAKPCVYWLLGKLWSWRSVQYRVWTHWLRAIPCSGYMLLVWKCRSWKGKTMVLYKCMYAYITFISILHIPECPYIWNKIKMLINTEFLSVFLVMLYAAYVLHVWIQFLLQSCSIVLNFCSEICKQYNILCIRCIQSCKQIMLCNIVFKHLIALIDHLMFILSSRCLDVRVAVATHIFIHCFTIYMTCFIFKKATVGYILCVSCCFI